MKMMAIDPLTREHFWCMTPDQLIEDNKENTELKEKIGNLCDEINRKCVEMKKLLVEYANSLISPCKIGEYVSAEVPSGKSKKWTKCLLELNMNSDTTASVYVRPIKNDGELSGRHFEVLFISGTSYSSLYIPIRSMEE